MKKIKRRTCGQVNGQWFNYFKKIVDIEFTDEVCVKYEKIMSELYGDFFERNLSTNGGKLLSLGAGFGATEIPLARQGYKIIGIDNDKEVLKMLEINAQKYAKGNLEARFGDLYEDFHKEYLDENIQACVSFGTLEHFERYDLDELIKKQFMINELIICMMPINTPETLETFKAKENPLAHIDENGIYRNFWSAEFWEKDIFGKHNIIDKCFPTGYSSIGQTDMVALAVKRN